MAAPDKPYDSRDVTALYRPAPRSALRFPDVTYLVSLVEKAKDYFAGEAPA